MRAASLSILCLEQEGGFSGLSRKHHSCYPNRIQISPFLQAGLHESKNIEKNQPGFSSRYSHLNIPIWGNVGLLGWIEAISHKKQKPYADEDINLIKSLASQFALVLERIDTIASLQRRLLEMEILNKFALTVNSVSDLDQLLTACFDHIQQVIPIDSLSLILKQPDPIGHQRVFLYEDGQILITATNPSTLGNDYPEKDGLTTPHPSWSSKKLNNGSSSLSFRIKSIWAF